jgi:hypothetical protein
MSKKKPVTDFKSGLREYYGHYLSSRLSMQDVSLVLRRNKNWLSQYLSSDDRGISSDVLLRLYVMMPELMEDVELGIIGQPVVRDRGRQPA